jgi:hypothetical protein
MSSFAMGWRSKKQRESRAKYGGLTALRPAGNRQPYSRPVKINGFGLLKGAKP